MPADINNSEKDPLKVNSANDWEHCKLDGETKRHDKFMKLMGAEKKVHKGTFVIGDQRERTRNDDQAIQNNLCEQYTTGMENKGKRRVGLGFDGDAKPASSHEPAKGEGEKEPLSTSSSTCANNDDKMKSTTQSKLCSPGVKRKPEVDSGESDEVQTIHSANDWEHSKLENDSPSRHDKFMKLMGSKKTEHCGQFVIGSAEKVHNTCNDVQYKEVGQVLEKQFESSEIRSETDNIKQCPNDEKYKGIGFPHISDKLSEAAEGEEGPVGEEDVGEDAADDVGEDRA